MKLINGCLILTSLIGYLEWGQGRHTFLFQMEAGLFSGKPQSKNALLHPAVLIPLCGQLLLLYTLFQKTPGRLVSMIGLACLSTIMLLLLFIGITAPNLKIAVSALPFTITAILAIRHRRKKAPRT